jgi:hypothetical protein
LTRSPGTRQKVAARLGQPGFGAASSGVRLATCQNDREESWFVGIPRMVRILISPAGPRDAMAPTVLEDSAHIFSGGQCALPLLDGRQLRSQGRKDQCADFGRSTVQSRTESSEPYRVVKERSDSQIRGGGRALSPPRGRPSDRREVDLRTPLMLTETGVRAKVQNEIWDEKHDAAVPGVRTPGFMMAPHSRLGRVRVGPEPRGGKRALFTCVQMLEKCCSCQSLSNVRPASPATDCFPHILLE